MNKLYYYNIDHTTENQTVEQFLRSIGYSKKILIHLRQTPMGITINESLVYTTHLLKYGETLKIQLIEQHPSDQITPTRMELDIIYEDDDLLVINKPAAMPIHPSQGHYDHTLANGIAHYLRDKQQPFVFRAINRLDRDTTGLVLIAKHMLSAAILYQMVKDRKIKRQYLALAAGEITQNGTIAAPIARLEGSTIERCVNVQTGESACTHYQPLHYDRRYDLTLIRLWLETGRTHQIRVHMKYIGHPLPGDFLYHPDYRYINRQALHSAEISFEHPLTHQLLHLEAPLPDDMEFVFHGIRKPLG